MKRSRVAGSVGRRVWSRAGVVLPVIAALFLALLTPRLPAAATPRMQRGTVELCGGQCVHETITFETGDLRIDRIDVVFLLDVSGSMGSELGEVQEESVAIMEALRDLVPDSAFGVASFVDYNGFTDSLYGTTYGSDDDYAYRLDQNVTESIGAVRDALDGITLEYGEDAPEAYSRALWEMQYLDWREDSKRIVILFGDAYPHDRTFFGEDFGVDPGRDEIEGTDDDLVFVEVVEQLVDARISVIGVNSDPDSTRPVEFFQYVTAETGGAYFELTEAADIPEAVVALIEEEVSTIDRLTVQVAAGPAGVDEWLAVSPPVYTGVGSFESQTFEVDICPAAGDAAEGRYDFDLAVDGDGVALETVPISIDYTRRCTTGPEVTIPDHDEDDGSVCTSGPFWQSPGIIVRNRADGVRYHQNPIRGQTNYIYAQVYNIGDEDASDVSVTLYWANAAVGLAWPLDWHEVGSTLVDVSAGESVWTEAIAFDPPGERGADHYCLLARIESAEDPITREGDVPCDNNIAQRNLNILDLAPGDPESSDEVSFTIIAPPPELWGVIDIVIVLPGVPAGTNVWITLPSALFDLWMAEGGDLEGGTIDGGRILADPDAEETIIRGLPLEPGEEADVDVEIEAPIDEDTEPFNVIVVERVDGRDVGGITYYYAPPPPPNVLGRIWGFVQENAAISAGVGCCGGLGVLLVVLAVVLLRRRRSAPPGPVRPAGRVYGHICPRCQTVLPDAASFCPRCGSQAVDVAPPDHACPSCGAPAAEGAAFCAECGARLRAE